ncbi:MAG: hypothetical protein D6722_22975 [Bacteroidetes bacterium]|nr:MAG: hypothetical protein D6722_22975 [Bacteroidota bacterium]
MNHLLPFGRRFGVIIWALFIPVSLWAQGETPSIPIPQGIPQNLPFNPSNPQGPIVIPPGTLPGGQIPIPSTGPSATPDPSSGYPTPGPSLEGGSEIDLEGEDPVLDEEEADFSNKPKGGVGTELEPEPTSNVFGHELFNYNYEEDESPFELAEDRIPPDDYIVGPGDRFGITVYGPSELSESLLVSPDGSIIRSYLGKIYVAGMTYGEARSLLTTKYRSIVSARSQIEVLLVPRQRTIRVNIVGEVRQPGSYEVPASTTAFNALFAARGITDLGTVRNIQVKRKGQTIAVLDLYQFLVFGHNQPIFLENNDFIFVPVQGRIVEVEGPVKRPKEYELVGQENLKALLTFAGGLRYDALRKKAQVARLDRQTEREVMIDFNLGGILDTLNKDFLLLSGDRVMLRTVNKGAFNTVDISGNVEYPGTYQLLEGDRVSEVVLRAGGLGIDAYRERAYLIRMVPQSSEVRYIPLNLREIFPLAEGDRLEALPDSVLKEVVVSDDTTLNLALQPFDRILIFSLSDFQDQNFISVEGQIRKPGVFLTTETMNLRDLLFLVGGPTRDADLNNVELSIITRPEFLDVEGELENAEEGDGEGEGETEADPPLLPPGVTGYDDEGNPLEVGIDQQIVQRISLGPDWSQNTDLDTILVRPFDRIKVYSKYDFIFPKFIDVEGAVNRPGRFQLKVGMTLKDLLYLAGGLTEDADVNEVELYRDIDLVDRGNFNLGTEQEEILRIAIEEDWQNGALTDTLEVTPFHKLVVRSERDFFVQGRVIVKGLVNNPDTFDVLPNMTLLDLLYMAEGVQMEADFENIELYRIVETETVMGEIIPVPVRVNTVSTIQQWQKDSTLKDIKVNAFDMIFVRKNPDFELQESVYVVGEVMVPGEYVKVRRAERLSSVVARSGGITELADLEGAYISRPKIGKISLKLDRALRRRGGRFDTPILEGDTLVVPPRVDVVGITGNVLKPNTQVLFDPNKKRFKYYVNLAGGFARRTKKKHSTVTYVDGRVKRPKQVFLFRFYPRVEQGAIIEVAAKPEKKQGRLQRFDLNSIMSTVTSVLMFYLLIDRTLGQ